MSKLTAIEKKKRLVVIARDIVKQLKLKRFIASPGTYFYVPDLSSSAEWMNGKDFQAELQPKKHCEVCALGAMFISYVDKYDSISGSSINRVPQKMREIFGSTQTSQIEAVFEGFRNRGITKTPLFQRYWGETEESRDALDESEKFHPTDRMLAIMRNIIRNKGEFKP